MGTCNETICDHCSGHTQDEDYLVYSGGEETWCESCTADEALDCQGCGELFDTSYDAGANTDWGYYCESCAGQRHIDWCSNCDCWYQEHCDYCRNQSEYIHDYSYKPYPNFHPSDGSKDPSGRPWAYMGVELEWEISRNSSADREDVILAARQYDNDENIFYFKEDGSLGDGAEMVFHPRTLDNWHLYAEKLAPTLSSMHRTGARCWERRNCGMHIHISRIAFVNRSHIARMAYAISINSDKLIEFAGRESSYANFSGLERSAVKKAAYPWMASHNDAFNMSPPATCEFRIFRPSLTVGRFIANLELTQALFEYTASSSAHDAALGGLSWERFVDWMRTTARFSNATHVADGGSFEMSDTFTLNTTTTTKGESQCA